MRVNVLNMGHSFSRILDYELFNFLYGNGVEIKKLRGRIIKSLSHLIPEYLTKQPAASR